MRANRPEPSGSNRRRTVDLRSDTVTRPSDAMRRAMAAAEVGDDVYGEDPTVAALEAKAAEMLGKEAGIFLPSGTQSNLVALMSHCQRGEEFIVGDCNHIYRYEAGGAAVLGSLSPCPIPTGSGGGMSLDAVSAAINADDPHFAATRLICLENTVSGRVQNQAEIDAIGEMAHERGLSVHLDGARLMNAAVASNRAPAELVEKVDSVSLCLSKGLGAPVGSVLCGPRDFIAKALRNRKILGGAMRQVGVLAACGLYALEHNIGRLADDHRRATRLAEGLAQFPELKVLHDPEHTNMLFVEVPEAAQAGLLAQLAGEGIILADQRPAIRLVTHLDITDEDVEAAIAAVGSYFTGGARTAATGARG